MSPLALARTDFKRTAFSAEIQTNWMPRALGSMMLRPGAGYTGATRGNAAAISIPFIFAVDDTARLELTSNVMRVWVNDALVTRAAVTTAITNGTFDTDLTGWSDEDGGAAVSAWVTGGFMGLTGSGTAAARRRQQVTVGGNAGIRHAINLVVTRGPVLLRVGSAAGGDQYISETILRTGSHSLALTPTGDFWIDVFAYNQYQALITSITIAAAGIMEITTPWAESNLADLRWDQSGDVVFVACTGIRQQRIERRAVDSWSVVTYQSDNGPFMVQNVSPVTITPSAAVGDITLTSSAEMFKTGHLGALFRLTQTGQAAQADLSGADQYSDPIRVVGVGATRGFAIIITGTWVGTITLQYSVGEPGDWIDAAAPGGAGIQQYTANAAQSYNDTLDNQIIYYRIGFKPGQFTSGSAHVSLSISSGSQTGIARITSITSNTVVNAQVVKAFGKTTATSDWSESYWSAFRGFPSAVALDGGRLWWAGRDRIWASVSDSFENFDDTTVGDSGPINRSIGSGPVDRIYWMLSLQRLILGAGGNIWSVRSSSFDEPITPTNFNLKKCGQGSAKAAAVPVDDEGAYIQRSNIRPYQAKPSDNGYDYVAEELAAHVPEVGEPGLIRIALQRQPETRLHFIRSDGTVAILVFDPGEEVQCWIDYETDGIVEDCCVLPGLEEDQVYYTTKRTVNGSDRRYHEKWAKEKECVGGVISKLADSFIVKTGAAATVTGLDHLEGEQVVCWADGVDKGVFTVAGGAIPVTYTSAAVAGLGYSARYKSVKLAYGTKDGETALCQKKKVSKIGIIARDIHPRGLTYGPDFDLQDDLPAVEQYEVIDPDAVRPVYDELMFEMAGDWSTDSRVCLEAHAPLPVTLLALVMNIEAHETQ